MEEGGSKERELINHIFSSTSPLSVTGGYSKRTEKPSKPKAFHCGIKTKYLTWVCAAPGFTCCVPSAVTPSALRELRRSG